jgi:hypothetical protein
MKVLALFDRRGKIHALFHPSTEADAPQLRFHPGNGRRAEMLDVPAEFQRLDPRHLHAALRVELAGGTARLAAQKKRQVAAQRAQRKKKKY